MSLAARPSGRTRRRPFGLDLRRVAGRTSRGAMAERARWATRMRSTSPTTPIRRSRPHSGSRASPAGFRSRGGRRSGRRECARPGRHGLRRARRGADCEVARRRAGRRGRSECRGARACTGLRRRCDAPPRRGRRSRGGIQGRLRRRGPELRLRPALGRARAAAVQAAAPRATDRQPRTVGRRDGGARVGRGALQEPLDPRSHELRRPGGRARGALPAARRPCGRGRDPLDSSPCRSTPSATRGAARRRAPARNSSSCRRRTC